MYEFSGRAVNISLDYSTKKCRITFEINEDEVLQSEYEQIKEIEKLKITVSKWKNKRSLDANAYFHVLVGKIAEAMTISKAKAKNMMICRYGQPEVLKDGSMITYETVAPDEYMCELETIHSIPIQFNEFTTVYKIYRGSHTYDTNEMCKLIDGTVAEAKELGIETLTPLQLREMKERWGV